MMELHSSSEQDIISEKRLKMMELHSSSEQVRTIANSMTVAARHTLDQCLQGLSSAIEEAGPDVPVSLENFLPSDRCRRYENMEHVKAGMNLPTVLVTYSPGGNILATFIGFGIPHVQTSRRLCSLVSLFLTVIFLNFTLEPCVKQLMKSMASFLPV